MDEIWITGKQAAQLLHVHPETLRQMHARGELNAVRVQRTPKGHRRYHQGDISSHVRSTASGVSPARRSSGMMHFRIGMALAPMWLLSMLTSLALLIWSAFGDMAWSTTLLSMAMSGFLFLCMFWKVAVRGGAAAAPRS